MKKVTTIILSTILSFSLFAQQKEFEGFVVYNVTTKSKTEGIPDKTWKTILGIGDSLKVFIKNGNYKRISGKVDEYYIPAKQKAYIKIAGIDTLFFRDYSSDTTSIISIAKLPEHKTIADVDCNALLKETRTSKKKFFYAPSLYINPDHDRNNTIGRYDAYVKETQSVWLSSFEETVAYTLSYECIRLQAMPVENSVFDLPALPQKEFYAESITSPPQFTRSGGWIRYLQTNLNAELGGKYVKLARKEESATETVLVNFLVDEKGKVVNAHVVNRKEVHPKLAEEALRVINESPLWKPGICFGEKVPYVQQQPINFMAVRK